MSGKNFGFWCCVILLLLVALLSKSQQSSTSNKEKDNNLTIRYELDVDSTINYGDEMKTLRYNLYEKSINNMQNDKHRTSFMNNDYEVDSMQYEPEMQSISIHENDSYMLMKLRTNSTKIDRKINSTSQEIYRDLMGMEGNNDFALYEFNDTSNENDNKYKILPYEMCDNITCIPLCCPYGDRLIDDKCVSEKEKNLTSESIFPNVYKNLVDFFLGKSKGRIDKFFNLVIQDPCQKSQHYLLKSHYGNYFSDYLKYMFFTNGSLYLPNEDISLNSTLYCLAIMQDKYDVIVCSKTIKHLEKNKKSKEERVSKQFDIKKYISKSLHIMSVLFLLGTFLVYSVLMPNHRNTYNFMLWMYSGLKVVNYILHTTNILISLPYSICAFIKYFLYLASGFWLTVMSFDMWWTFKELRILRNGEQEKKKKLVIYFIYVLSFSSIFIIVSGVMNFAPGIPEYLRPFFHCTYRNFLPAILCMYLPERICSIISICFSISTALKIRRYEKNVKCHLRNSERRCYKENKKWFNLSLMLFIIMFIIMGIRCIIITLLSYIIFGSYFKYNEFYGILIICGFPLMDMLINLSIFIIFVCKKTIMRQLLKRLKRFGCQKYFPKLDKAANTISVTCSTDIQGISMPEITSSCRKTDFHETHTSDVTEL